jgi:hypothetical protein
MSSLTRLHTILNRAGISDDEIRGGIALAKSGKRKLATRFNTDEETISTLIRRLKEKLTADHDHDMTVIYEGHSGPRYTYEADYLDNVTVRDGETGDEIYLNGIDGTRLLRSLDEHEHGSHEEQEILKRACTERLTEGEEAAESFVAEIARDGGTFNFPWSHDGRSGTATAAYVANEEKFTMKVIHARDDKGEEISDKSTALTAALERQAREFIGNE